MHDIGSKHVRARRELGPAVPGGPQRGDGVDIQHLGDGGDRQPAGRGAEGRAPDDGFTGQRAERGWRSRRDPVEAFGQRQVVARRDRGPGLGQ